MLVNWGRLLIFRPTIVGSTAKYCIDQYMVLFRYCSLGGNTAMPGWLHASFATSISSYLFIITIIIFSHL